MLSKLKIFIRSLTPTSWSLVAGGVLLLALVLTLTYCQGRQDGSAGAELAREKANVEAIATSSAAAETAGDERLADHKATSQQAKELSNACADLTDDNARRTCRGCVILRQQGTRIDDIAACRGFAGKD